jgi:hypothetical protein
MDTDYDIQKALEDLNANEVEGFNRSKITHYLEYFDNKDSTTPSNTPSAKKNSTDFSLKSVDFDKFLNVQNNYDSYASSNLKSDLTFCEETYIGNTKDDFGITQNGKKLICSNLLCSKCDIKVSIFKNKKWNDSCDYMFFRNNYGDQIKLSEVMFYLFRNLLIPLGLFAIHVNALGLIWKMI